MTKNLQKTSIESLAQDADTSTPSETSVLAAIERVKHFDHPEKSCCLLSSSGEILWVNEGWRKFGNENGLESSSVGKNYFRVIEKPASGADFCPVSRFASEAFSWLLMQMCEKLFRIEYPCHSASAKRWFEFSSQLMYVNGRKFIFVQHTPVTDSRLEEDKREEATPMCSVDLSQWVHDPKDLDFKLDRELTCSQFLHQWMREKKQHHNLEVVGQYIRHQNWSKVEFVDSEFFGVEFNKVIFDQCRFQNVQFVNCYFRDCEFNDCSFNQSQVHSSSFSHTIFSEGKIPKGLSLEHCRFVMPMSFPISLNEILEKGHIQAYR